MNTIYAFVFASILMMPFASAISFENTCFQSTVSGDKICLTDSTNMTQIIVNNTGIYLFGITGGVKIYNHLPTDSTVYLLGIVPDYNRTLWQNGTVINESTGTLKLAIPALEYITVESYVFPTPVATPSGGGGGSVRLNVTKPEYCGDGICNFTESFNNCPSDCTEETIPYNVIFVAILFFGVFAFWYFKKKKPEKEP